MTLRSPPKRLSGLRTFLSNEFKGIWAADLLVVHTIEANRWGRLPAHLIHDRDAVYGPDFDRRAAPLGITGVRTPARAPKADSIAKRLVETIRRECLDHVIVVSEGPVRGVPAEFTHYYNHERPDRTLSLQRPVPYANPGHGPAVSTPALGGLDHA